MTSSRSRPALPSLTALRAAAALAVFGYHAVGMLQFLGTGHVARGAGRLLAAGPTGVSFFFVLSGFVLTWSAGSASTASSFWRRRVARILPAYLIAWCLGLVVLAGLHHPAPVGGAIASLLLVQAWSPDHQVTFAANIVAWSLAVEAFFYLLFPVVLPALRRMPVTRRRPLMLALLVIPVIVASAEQVLHGSAGYLWPVAYLPIARLPEFLLGALLALEIADGRWPRIPLWVAASFAAVGYLLACRVPQAFMWVSVTLAPYVLVIGAAATTDLLDRRSPLRARSVVRLGVWSYAFYLLQVPIGLVLAKKMHPVDHRAGTDVLLVGTYLMVTWLAAAALFRWVEEPAHRLLLRGRGVAPVPVRPRIAPEETPDAARTPALSDLQSDVLPDSALPDAILPVPLSEELP